MILSLEVHLIQNTNSIHLLYIEAIYNSIEEIKWKKLFSPLSGIKTRVNYSTRRSGNKKKQKNLLPYKSTNTVLNLKGE